MPHVGAVCSAVADVSVSTCPSSTGTHTVGLTASARDAMLVIHLARIVGVPDVRSFLVDRLLCLVVPRGVAWSCCTAGRIHAFCGYLGRRIPTGGAFGFGAGTRLGPRWCRSACARALPVAIPSCIHVVHVVNPGGCVVTVVVCPTTQARWTRVLFAPQPAQLTSKIGLWLCL